MVNPILSLQVIVTVIWSTLFVPSAQAEGVPITCISGSYVDAIVSAGSTTYVFLHKSGVELSVSVPNEIQSAVNIEPNLLRLLPNGPAEANEEFLGKSLNICFGPGKLMQISSNRI